MSKKFSVLSKSEEIARAQDTLLRGTCFVSKVSLSDKPYELVFHAGSGSYVFVAQEFVKKFQE